MEEEVVEVVVEVVETVVAGLPVCDFVHLTQALLLLLKLAFVIVFVDEYRLTLPWVERRAEQIAEEGLEHRGSDKGAVGPTIHEFEKAGG